VSAAFEKACKSSSDPAVVPSYAFQRGAVSVACACGNRYRIEGENGRDN